LEPVHLRHLQVQQHDVDAALAELVDRLAAGDAAIAW
jgi:hypothetical protein